VSGRRSEDEQCSYKVQVIAWNYEMRNATYTPKLSQKGSAITMPDCLRSKIELFSIDLECRLEVAMPGTQHCVGDHAKKFTLGKR